MIAIFGSQYSGGSAVFGSQAFNSSSSIATGALAPISLTNANAVAGGTIGSGVVIENAYSQSWLENPTAMRGLLVEATVFDVVAGSDIVMYLSNIGYLTGNSLVSFNPIISGGMSVTESIDLSGNTSMSFGDIELSNLNGELDNWLDATKYIWVNGAIQVYLGDPSWVCANLAAIHINFLKIFDGVIADIDTKSRESLNLKVRDKLERLNTPLTETKLGAYGNWGAGGQTNKDTIQPIVFGEVFNIEPLLIDPSVPQYLFNLGLTEKLIEIRDNGMPIYTTYGTPLTGATADLANGKFTLPVALAGTPTVSVQGVRNSIDLNTGALVSPATYNNNVANLIALIVTQYGKVSTRLNGATDLDLSNLAAFAANSPQYVGIAVTDRTNVLNVCQQLANSVGAQLFMTRLGRLQLLQLGVPTADATITITDDDILHHSLGIANRLDVVASTKLGYCKNWSVQTGLVTSIPMQHKDIFATQWLTTTTTDTTVQSRYKLNADPVAKETCLLTTLQASVEATRLNEFFKVPKTVYKFTAKAKMLSLKLGQSISLVHNRFGLSAGKAGQVIKLSPNWMASTIDVEVII